LHELEEDAAKLHFEMFELEAKEVRFLHWREQQRSEGKNISF